jgi:Ca2+/H+ antiporter, TMEM165/GDT1 family
MINVVQVMPTVLASFMASLVEFVEALTVVLAVGSVRGWKATLGGTAGALLTLVVLVVLLGRSLALVPIFLLQVGIGVLLLLFGLRWLRKAILRAAGALPLHDEDKAFEKETASLRLRVPADHRWDRVAFATAYKIVMLEGIEVVFIVIALGSSAAFILPAAVGAAGALGCVVLLGLALHRPLSTIPENTLKFAVGILLTAFGTFWVGEGIGVTWPTRDGSVLALIVIYLLIGSSLVFLFRRRADTAFAARHSISPQARRNLISRLSSELISLFIDDGWLASGTVAWVALFALALRVLPHAGALSAFGFTVGLGAILSISGARALQANRNRVA